MGPVKDEGLDWLPLPCSAIETKWKRTKQPSDEEPKVKWEKSVPVNKLARAEPSFEAEKEPAGGGVHR